MYEITNTDYQPMQELIKITEQNGKRAVSARELHKFLEVQTPFTMWIDRMFEYGFAENIDFEATNFFVNHPNSIGGTKRLQCCNAQKRAKRHANILLSAKSS